MALTGLSLWVSDRYSTIGTQLSFSETTYNNITLDTLEEMGIETEAEGESKELHKVATFMFWKKCLTDVSLDITFSADGASYNRSDLHKQILDNYSRSLSEAMPYLSSGNLSVDYGDNRNPYIYDQARDLAGNY